MKPESIYISRELCDSPLCCNPNPYVLSLWLASLFEADWVDDHHGYFSFDNRDISDVMYKAFKHLVKLGEFTVLEKTPGRTDVVINNAFDLISLEKEE